MNDSLIDAKLTASEYRLYLYLVKFDSTAPLPDPKTIIERLGINRDTFFTAVARLAELGLYEYRQRREADRLSNGRIAK